jgi:short-subunit dehydrogenase
MQDNQAIVSAKPFALVTGASSGIGVEFARQLADRGYTVGLVARRRERLEALAAELEALGQPSLVIPADLSAPRAAEKLVQELQARGLRPDILVNNAGVGVYGAALDSAADRVEALLHLNVLALTELALTLGRLMAERGSGTIINVSSTSSFQPDPWLAVYGASKAYVTSFSLALGQEIGPKGVHVMTLCPGLTRTEFDATAGVTAAHTADWMYMSARECVEIALRGLDRRRRLVVAGWMNRIAAFFARLAPLVLVTRVNARLLAPRQGPPKETIPTARGAGPQ